MNDRPDAIDRARGDAGSSSLLLSTLSQTGWGRRCASMGVILIGFDEESLPDVRRELFNVSVRVEGEYPDIFAATRDLGAMKREEPIFLVEVESDEDIERLYQLHLRFPGRPIVVVTNPTSDATVIRAMRAGATQVVFRPIESQDFEQAMSCVAHQFGYTQTTNQVFAVCGVSGGCGATTVAINLAYEFGCRHNVECILIDMSLKLGRLPAYLDVQPRFTTQDFLADIERMDPQAVEQMLTRFDKRLSIVAGPYGAIDSSTISPTAVTRLVEMTKRLSDIVVLDLPGTCDELFLETLACAEHVIFVGEQELPSMSTMKLVRDLVHKRLPTTEQTVVINRYDPRERLFDVRHLKDLLAVSSIYTISNDRRSVMSAINHGRPLRIEVPGSRIVGDFAALAESLIETGNPAASVPHGLGRRFLRALKVLKGDEE